MYLYLLIPCKENGIGAGQTSDLRWVESCAREICKSAEVMVVVEKYS